MADNELTSEEEKQIIEHMNQLNKIVDFNTLNQIQAQQAKETINKLLLLFKQISNSQIYLKTDILEFYIYLLKLDQKFRNTSFYEDNRLQVILNYNIAYCYQELNEREKALQFILAAVEELEKFLAKSKIGDKRLLRFFLQLKLQTGALYGTVGESEKAIETAFEAFNLSKTIADYLKEDFKQEITPSFADFERLSYFFGDFEKFFFLKDKEIKHAKENKIKASKFLTWERNPVNYEKELCVGMEPIPKKFKLHADFLLDRNIGDIMRLELIDTELFSPVEEKEADFNNDVVYLLLLFTCSLYIVATEKREMAGKSEKTKKKNTISERKYSISNFFYLDNLKDSHSGVNANLINSLLQNKLFIESEFFMKKCLEVLFRYFNYSVPVLLNYVFRKYKETYSNVVNYITEEEEPSKTISFINRTDRKDKNNRDNEESSISNIIINNINISNTMCNVTGKPNFNRKTPKDKQLNEFFDITPIKNLDANYFDSSLGGQDLSEMLRDLQKDSTKESHRERPSDNEPTTQEKTSIKEDKKDKKEKQNFKTIFTKSQKTLSDAIKAQKYDALMRDFKELLKNKKRISGEDVQRIIAMKKPFKSIKQKSTDPKKKSKNITDHIKRKISVSKKEININNLTTFKKEKIKMNFKKLKTIFLNKNKNKNVQKTLKTSKEGKVNFDKRKNSPLMTQRNKNVYKFLKRYKTVDLSNNVENQLSNSKKLKSPREKLRLDMKSINKILKSSNINKGTKKESTIKKQEKMYVHDEYGELTVAKTKKEKKKKKLASPRPHSKNKRGNKTRVKTSQSPRLKLKKSFKTLFK